MHVLGLLRALLGIRVVHTRDREAERGRLLAEGAVDAAIHARRLAPSLRAWALEYAAADPSGFREFLSVAPELRLVAIAPTSCAAAATCPNADPQVRHHPRLN